MTARHRHAVRIAALLAALALCLWIGWRDLDPWMPQEVVRGTIRHAIRRGLQATLQFVAPVVLIAMLLREVRRRAVLRRPRRTR